jgi:phosphatidylinositol glycan class T
VKNTASFQLPFVADRYLTGYGGESGGIEVELINNNDRPQRIVYLDVLPWFLKVYLHTLDFKIRSHKGL